MDEANLCKAPGFTVLQTRLDQLVGELSAACADLMGV